LHVYGRAGRPCLRCGARIRKAELGDRVTYWCPECQKGPHRQDAGTSPSV
ncbi:zinc finger domain-containing protein, partial [Streptomyces cinereoruber]